MNTLELTPEFAPARMAPAGAPPAARTPTRLLLAGAATFSVAAGLIHFAAVPEHWGEYRWAALFFIALGIFQVAWAALVVGRPSRMLYAVGAAVSLVTIAIWAISRTSGLPFGPFAGIAERAGRADIISTVLEQAVVIAVILLAYGVGEQRSYGRAAFRGGLAALGTVTAAVTVWGAAALSAGAHGDMAGSPQMSVLSEVVGHHGLHLVFAGGAVLVYGGYVIAHVRRHGWPSFSWRLSP